MSDDPAEAYLAEVRCHASVIDAVTWQDEHGIVWQCDPLYPGVRLEFVPPVDGRYGLAYWSGGVYVYETGLVDMLAGIPMWLKPEKS